MAKGRMKYRLMTKTEQTGKIFLSPLVYSKEHAEGLIKRLHKGLFKNKECVITAFPVRHYPESVVWSDHTYKDVHIKQFDSRIKSAEVAWGRYT